MIKLNYLDTIDKMLKEYYRILSWDFPYFLNDYIFTKEMQHQKEISVTCGKIYSKMFKYGYPYTSLDHSVGVALIVWNFTADKKQTLAGLFHDIASPVFKHTVDIFNGDADKQESTEEKTSDIIKNSEGIMTLLERDGIKLEEINDYHIYSIADNDTPRLSADRLEYSLSNALFVNELCDIEEIKRFYENIYVGVNEDKELELCFDDEVVEIINKSRLKDVFGKWANMKDVKVSKNMPGDYYWVRSRAKIRYIDPLVNDSRISSLSENARKNIANNFNYDMENYVYSDSIKLKKLEK